ncbi:MULTISPECIES: DUF502 domain-containing protein [Methylophaga]|jgi:uncharacterized membrane protein|uniref:DUF502 domain-containing protein n=1 Tax=Methylophaga muralis TaxID=291169 RepID=A0A1E3GSN8_9GAMM|nr:MULTISPECIES: DUF502 domain-containing protein [Methylophaga]ODN66576.1 hypothetical protein A9E74_01746 [Methylophaga muralis]THK41514.1 DUF502 domain-containing protein [Methylophaga sp. SB9B]
MQFVWKTFLKGLATVLPVTLTLYLIYWLAVSAEQALRPMMIAILPYDFYWPGLGLLAAIGLIFVIGIAVNAWLVKRLFDIGESILDRIPLVKSIHGALRDFTKFFSREKQQDNLNHAVAVTIGGVQFIGFLVKDDVSHLLEMTQDEEEENDLVAVYLPLSYQIGGYTICLPREQVRSLKMSNEDTMRWILTAGLSDSETESHQSKIILQK